MKGVDLMMALEASAGTAVTELLGIGTQCLTWIMDNAFLSVVFAGCLVPVAFKVIKAAKRAAK